METTLTIAALDNWPWQWSLTDREDAKYDGAGLRMREDAFKEAVDKTTGLRRSLLLAALAAILRPTNILIWITLAAMTCLKMSSRGWFARIPWTEQRVLMEFTFPAFLRATRRERTHLVTQSVLCGTAVLILSLLVDRFYYQFWTFPPLNFIFFNVVQSLSVFYGRNDWHYYLSQGFPLLLTTALPFAMVGIYQGFFSVMLAQPPLTKTILSQLATIACVVPAALSLISHKEVRFVYPLLPLLHLLAAEPLTQFFVPSIIHPLRSRRTPPHSLLKRLLLGLLIFLNAAISIYTTTVHNRGVLDVLTYLRQQHETYYLPHQGLNGHHSTHTNANLTAAFLVPCHSTPWRSHLVHSSISAWALTCEPPLHLPSSARDTYVDEADAFYADPDLWLRQSIGRFTPRAGVSQSSTRDRDKGRPDRWKSLDLPGKRYEWPDYLVFFEQAEDFMHTALRGSGYEECWRGFNSHWHDDWRRKGDVVVWCLFPERRIREEEEMAARRRQRVKIWLEGVERVKRVVGGRMDGSWWSGRPWHYGKGVVGRNVPAVSREHGDSVLGGAKGPWGIGRSRPESKDSKIKRWWNSQWRGKAQRKKKQPGTWS
jgi:GPI mannosyltransferase 3